MRDLLQLLIRILIDGRLRRLSRAFPLQKVSVGKGEDVDATYRLIELGEFCLHHRLVLLDLFVCLLLSIFHFLNAV